LEIQKFINDSLKIWRKFTGIMRTLLPEISNVDRMPV
jgi:hypothetical protein